MKIDTTIMIPVAAVVASVLLFLAGSKRILEIIALAASSAWLLLELNLYNWPFKQAFLSSGMVLGGAMFVAGVLVYLRTSNKREVTASTVLTILGGVLVVGALNRLG